MVDALFATPKMLYGVSKERGEVFSVALGEREPRTKSVHSSEHQPSAVLVVADELIWATADGVFASSPSGQDRRPLKSGLPVHALASSGAELFFASDDALWQMDRSSSRTSVARKVAADVAVDELVAVGRALVWRDLRELWRLDLESHSKIRLPDYRKPNGLSTDGHVVFWHEGEPDLLPGREPMGFVADGRTWTIRESPGEYDSGSGYLLDGKYIFGPAQCKELTRKEWTRVGTGDPQAALGRLPVAANETSWFWVEKVCGDGGCDSRSRIFVADKALCRH